MHEARKITLALRAFSQPHDFHFPMLSSLPRITILATLLLGGAASAQNTPQMDLPRQELSAGMYRIDAQVASTPEQREIGLMFRQGMPMQEGMLFVFQQSGVQCFWMRNTRLPLTAAFIRDDGRIVNLADMQPLSEQSHCSSEPVRYVLEMNQGWFSSRGIKAGSQLHGVPFDRTQ